MNPFHAQIMDHGINIFWRTDGSCNCFNARVRQYFKKFRALRIHQHNVCAKRFIRQFTHVINEFFYRVGIIDKTYGQQSVTACFGDGGNHLRAIEHPDRPLNDGITATKHF